MTDAPPAGRPAGPGDDSGSPLVDEAASGVRAELDVDAFVARVAERVRSVDRTVIGIAGPPGAGKSTLTERLRIEHGAVPAPMDGFHLRNEELRERGLLERKGAPETFDAARFVAAVEALADGSVDVPWPSFDRGRDEPVEAAIVVDAGARLVVVEGNYLVSATPPWDRVVGLLDEVAYLHLDRDVRIRRLIDRHVAHGRTVEDATAFVHRSDEVNAAFVAADRHRASLVVRVK